MDRAAAEEWIRAHVEPAGAIETLHERPWATVLRVPLTGGVAWFKACAPVQAFEPRLTAELFARWPDRVAEVLGHDEERSWLLLADAGTAIGVFGNPPEAWLAALPLYAELQRGEAVHARAHVARGVPELRVARLPARYEDLLRGDLPLDGDEIGRLRSFTARFTNLCDELAAYDIPETVQHDDLHMTNVYAQGERLRLLDWGDASISHPFASLVVTFRFLEETGGLPPSDPWFARLRDAYLEPWGSGLADVFDAAMRVGTFAHTFAWSRQRDALPAQARRRFDKPFSVVLRRAVALTQSCGRRGRGRTGEVCSCDEPREGPRDRKLFGAAVRQPVEIPATGHQPARFQPTEGREERGATNAPSEGNTVRIPHHETQQPRLGHPTT